MATPGRLTVPIPDELVSAVAERRVIPFIGAGFSAALEMPEWEGLLAKVAAKTDGSLPYSELHKLTRGDLLQIAEYLYLKSYRQIGPIRHIIEQELPARDPVISGPHVELVNLGAPQIYTTNYDDLIEDTFHNLGLKVSTVTMPRDVAQVDSEVTQVVKYHGDLRHDQSLVLPSRPIMVASTSNRQWTSSFAPICSDGRFCSWAIVSEISTSALFGSS